MLYVVSGCMNSKKTLSYNVSDFKLVNGEFLVDAVGLSKNCKAARLRALIRGGRLLNTLAASLAECSGRVGYKGREFL